MALTDENGSTGMVMPVSPMYGNGNGGFMDGGNGWWVILLFILLGGWGNGFGCNGNGGGLYPWMNQSNQISGGFRDQMINDNVTSIRDGVYGISNQLCSGFAGVNATVNGAQNAIAQQMYGNQIADMERSFAAQTANTAGLTALQAQLAQCCCDNRAATADLKYTVATEACADRNALSSALRDVLAATQAQTQTILDKMCQDKIDAKNDEIATLRQQIAMKDLAASQAAQNTLISNGFNNEIDALYNRLNSCPVATVPVYGRQPIFTQAPSPCGCGA